MLPPLLYIPSCDTELVVNLHDGEDDNEEEILEEIKCKPKDEDR